MTQFDWAAIDDEVERGVEDAVALLAALVRSPSTLGAEAPAQELVAGALEALGFAVERLAVDPAALASEPGSGIPLLPYDGRAVVVARRGGRSTRSLLLLAHVDVVPAGDEALWTTPPFAPACEHGWLRGRGAADMKGGLAMALLALGALHRAAPEALDGDLGVVSAIEEECGGNGALAALLAGVTADGVLLPEPTDLDLLVGGVGVLWCEVTVTGTGAHAAHSDGAASALDGAVAVAAGLRRLARSLEADDAATRDPAERYLVNVGTLEAGDWISSVPASARLGVRVGYPTALAPAEAQARVAAAVEQAWPGAGVRFTGFRAEGYRLADDDPLAAAVAACHRALHGNVPRRASGPATNDARFYARRGVPAVCYGPRGRNLHGVDEAVELASIAAGARTLTRLIPHWLHGAEVEA